MVAGSWDEYLLPEETMMTRMARSFTGRWILGILAAGMVISGVAVAADWPQFMGPNGDGTVTGAGVARTWPAEGPKVLWTAKLESGFGGPAIADGKVYLLDRIGTEGDKMRVFDLKTGKELWSFGYDAPGRVSYPGSRSTPFVTGELVFSVGTFGQLYCFSVKSRQPMWRVDLAKEHGASRGGWGFAQSPLVVDGKVIVSIQSDEHGLAAFDAKSGKLAWKTGPIGASDCYTSPMLATIAGVRQVVMFQKHGVAGVAPADGKILWKYTGYTGKRPIPNPVVVADGRIFLTSGYGAGCAMIKVTKTGEKFKVKELFYDKRSGSKVPPAILHGGHLYSNTEIGDGLQCMSLDGKVKWKTGGRPGFSLGSLIIADGLIYILGGSTGTLHLIEATPTGHKELAKATLLSGKNIWAPMALSDGKLVIRDQKQMKCVVVGKVK